MGDRQGGFAAISADSEQKEACTRRDRPRAGHRGAFSCICPLVAHIARSEMWAWHPAGVIAREGHCVWRSTNSGPEAHTDRPG